MITSERGFKYSFEQATWERFVTPERPEMPLIRVNKCEKGEVFNASFALELSGVIRPDKKDKEKNEETKRNFEFCRDLLMTGIAEGQGIEMIYSGGKKGGKRFFEWKIVGHSRGKNYSSAVDSINSLWRNINVALEPVRNIYEFTPVTDKTALPEAIRDGWFSVIKPQGIAVSTDLGRAMGFLSSVENTEKHQVILAPQSLSSPQDNIDLIPIGLSGCESEVSLILSISGIRLHDSEIKSLASSLTWLRNGQDKSVYYHPHLKGYSGDGDAVSSLESEMQMWLKKPYGLKINCMAVSKIPVPTSLLKIIGDNIFNGSSLSVRTGRIADGKPHFDSGEDNYTCLKGAVDLQGCVSSAETIPYLFPTASILLDHNVKRAFPKGGTSHSSDGILLGRSGSGSMTSDVFFSKSSRSRHLYCLGSTGTGKSSLLYNMIAQDIQNDQGVCIIDPHGDLYSQVLQSIPRERVEDVVLIDPSDYDHAVGINFLELEEGAYRQVRMNFIVNELVKIIDRLYDLRSTGGPIFELYMRNCLLLLLNNNYTEATLIDVPRVFEDYQFRKYLKANCNSPIVVDFWEKQAEEAGGEASLRNITPYITSKFNQFVSNALLSPIIGQTKSSINFRQIMDKKQIVLVNLSKGTLGQMDSELLGMLLLGKVFSSAISRGNIPLDKRTPFYLYIDEFQSFTSGSESLTQMLSEARKYGLCLTLANQNLHQLEGKKGEKGILESVIGNVGSTLIYRLGPIDAEKMSAYTKPRVTEQDLTELPDFHVAARLLDKNTPSKPFVFRTRPPMQPVGTVPQDDIISASRLKYARPTKEIEKQILARRTEYKNGILKEEM